MTLAETQAAEGEWASALQSVEAALERDAADLNAQQLRLDALGALGQGAELERALNSALEVSPCDGELVMRVLEQLPAGTSNREIARHLSDWQRMAGPKCEGFDHSWIDYVHAWWALVQGDVATLERLDTAAQDHPFRHYLPSALADKGRLLDAHAYLEGKLRCDIQPYDALAIALACRAGGNEAEAAAWEARALPQLTSLDDIDVARLLAGDRRGVADEALDLALPPWRKAVVLALVSLADEPHRVRLLEQAVRLQARPIFPRRLIEEMLSKAVPR